MKKLILNFATVLFVLSCFFLTSCEPEVEKVEKVEKTFSFEILNAADVDLKINSIVFYKSNISPLQDWENYIGTDIRQNIVQINKEIQKKSLTQNPASLKIDETIEYDTYNTPSEWCIKINCSYLTSNGTTAYPYVGTLNGEKVSIETTYSEKKYKTTDLYLAYEEGITLNFVKTTEGDYVLCIVK